MNTKPLCAARPRTILVSCWVLVALLLMTASADAQARRTTPDEIEPSESLDHPIIRALTGGAVSANLRLRGELADAEGSRQSQAHTARLRLGYTTAQYYGTSLFAEFEGTRAADYSLYNAAGLNGQPTKTVIADPEFTELNQAYVDWEMDSEAGLTPLRVRGGRQAIILDDQRFVGDVGWRQNQQTFDGVMLESRAFPDTTLQYAFIYHVHNIFNDQSTLATPTARRDFESKSHLFRAHFEQLEQVKITAFAYILDLRGRNPGGAANSSDTLGLRLAGKVDVNETIAVHYTASYAFQYDNNDNPTDYKANYFHATARVSFENISGMLGLDYLGTHNGRFQFRTPLATAHKFNGWADAFLDNGGPKGLQDVFAGVIVALPSNISGKVFYHKFNTADGGGDLGWEVDAILTKKFNAQTSALIKFAYFEGPRDPDVSRVWTDFVFKF